MANDAVNFLPLEAVKREGWYVIRTPPGCTQSESTEREEKTESSRPPPVPFIVPTNPPAPLLRHPMVRAARISVRKPIKAWLSYYTASSGAVNTAFNHGAVVQPNQDSSWASWQQTFDEFRVLEAEAIWNTYYTVDPTALPANSANTIVVYDPSNNTALTSVNAGLQFERYSMLRCMIPTAAGPKVSPMVTTPDGFAHFRVKIPRGTVNSTVDTLNSNGQWRPTQDAANYNYGSFIGYTSVGGATSVLRVEYFVRMLVEFRIRQ